MKYLPTVLAIVTCVLASTPCWSGSHLDDACSRLTDSSRVEIIAFERGVREAEIDISKDRLRIKMRGYLGADFPALRTVLKEEYGIEIKVAGGCVVAPRKAARLNGYNARMNDEIEAKFGEGVFDRIYAAVADKSAESRLDS